VLTMSIRMLAKELYRAMKEVEQLEEVLHGLAPAIPKRAELERQLLETRAEVGRIKAMLDGAKAD
jgi:hypothetical protein